MISDKEESINVLKAWHLVEFFQAYSVPDKESSSITPVNVSYRELASCGESLLPWLNQACKDSLGLSRDKKCTYTLYLGLFDKAVTDKKVEEYFSTESEQQFLFEEIEQRRDNEGMTCFAKLMLDEFGSPRLDTFSVSSLPWALAELLADRAGDISQARFDDRCDYLVEFLERWVVTLPEHPSIEGKSVLCAKNIMSLVQGLYEWAGLSTSDLKLTEDSMVDLFQMAFYESEVKPNNQLEDKTNQNEADVEVDEVEAESVDDESQLPILNSFYIRDIEKAINAVSSERASKPLLSYLQRPGSKHVDLYTDEAIPLIHDRLNPKETPEGRWLAEPAHNMSLMQQFAINTAFKDLDVNGLLSVNGPPGTGKTTLLRDIIAQNIVERAKVLASFSKAGEGLTSDGLLVEALTGYEMVVASSNNAAVENISKELPQKKSVADRYEDIGFFRPLSNQVNADESKGILQPLSDKNLTWGNVSAVMGAFRKRKKFMERFFFKKYYPKGDEPAVRDPSVDFLNYWQYRTMYAGPSFGASKKNFNEKLSRYNALNQELINLDTLERSCSQEKYEAALYRMEQELATMESSRASIAANLEGLKKKKQLEKQREQEVSVSLEHLKVNAPGFFSRLFNSKKNEQYKSSLSQKLKESEDAKRSIRLIEGDIFAFESDMQKAKKKLTQQMSDIAAKEQEYRRAKQTLEHYREKYQDYSLPDACDKIEEQKRQRNACWQHEDINQLRSDVYAVALQLHEAWLIEVSKIDKFRRQVMKINDVVLGKSREDTLAIWQVLFMFVPVISTTFASLGSMFSKLSPESLGWLMIDEAGQAIPQAAVGGLLRAKRAIVVGDPLQIEPVFTSPPRLVEYLMSSKLQSESEKWDPCLWSVQTLSDRVNPYGCMLDVDGEDKWIGIPLWVHRRCIEPMFSIANEIAYNSRMIHGSDRDKDVQARLHPELGANSWNESRGDCVLKQYKRELGADVLDILLEMAENGGDLSSVYVISPFKAVKNSLKDDLRQSSYDLLQSSGWSKKEFNSFLRNNVGTVHTFQGKENDTVILVLGCDLRNSGGASWASSKPNLLNVAVTRAKKHLFVVGDSQVWSDKRYFDTLFSNFLTNNSFNDNKEKESNRKMAV
ncbi:AAA domain-containing protein [Vibrio paucivorans]